MTLHLNSTIDELKENIFAQKELFTGDMRFSPIDYFYFTSKFLLNTNKERNIYYQPQYYYTFGYDDYHQDTWGFGYNNYQNNRFNPANDPYASSFGDGTWNINYKTKFKALSLKASASYRPSKKFTILTLGGDFPLGDKTSFTFKYEHYLTDPQERLALSTKVKFTDNIFVEGGVYLYSDLRKQDEFEGDYYYAFGWNDDRPKHFSISYSNQYKPLRFPWREQINNAFDIGQISLSYNL